MRYLVKVSYDGTRYGGWQIQPDAISIEEEIEKVLSKLLNTRVKIYGSGRTDAGVHAHGQTFHFDSPKELNIDKFRYSFNCLMPADIYALYIEKKSDDFHARYDAKSKRYNYLINIGEYDPFLDHHVYQLGRALDIDKMKGASKKFVGEHNFQNFTSKDEDQSNFVRNIYSIDISKDKNIIKLSFVGSGFMKYMVRMIVGTLIEIGLGRLDSSYIDENLDKNERKVTSYKAPSEGLYLEEVTY